MIWWYHNRHQLLPPNPNNGQRGIDSLKRLWHFTTSTSAIMVVSAASSRWGDMIPITHGLWSLFIYLNIGNIVLTPTIPKIFGLDTYMDWLRWHWNWIKFWRIDKLAIGAIRIKILLIIIIRFDFYSNNYHLLIKLMWGGRGEKEEIVKR